MKFLALAALLALKVNADCYLHQPRGSNNRLNEQSANRDNANRLFDSQNNNRGGYNVGDLDPENGFTANSYMATFDEMYSFEFLEDAGELQKQYEMLYFESSNISTTWTNQHGTGQPKVATQMILQFICDTFPRATAAGGEDGAVYPGATIASHSGWTDTVAANNNELALNMRKHGLRVELYNGGNTNTPNAPGNVNAITTQYTNNMDNNRGRRESEEYYDLCQRRSRNYGLFHADQNLNGESQIYTRQNPNGNRRGLECPEERDYYPWWNPSPFHDIAILTPDVDYCRSDIAPHSQNVEEKYSCVNPGATVNQNDPPDYMPENSYVEFNLNETECTDNGGEWSGFRWNGAEPECVDSYWTKVNYLGNADGTSSRGGKMAHYDWTLPSYDSLINDHYCYSYSYTVNDNGESTADTTATYNCVRMMFRIRYNMSTMDYDPYLTDSKYDEDNNQGIISPIENNPNLDAGTLVQGLQLAINTAQTGRTFQDNSHTFLVCERPTDYDNMNILNVNVRGKRGNIVQTFPAIEYDFEPQHIELDDDENNCMHFQWTGSNTHNNGSPGGDGQTGDDGEGRDGSDRSNLVQSRRMSESYPVAYDELPYTAESEGVAVNDFFEYVTCHHPLFPATDVSSEDAQLILGTMGFYRSVTDAQQLVETNNDDDAVIDDLLNNVSGSFKQGLICCVDTNQLTNEDLEFSFISTRNNNFSNRSQKLKIILSKSPDDTTTW